MDTGIKSPLTDTPGVGEKTINVLGKTGGVMAPCTSKRANKLVARKCAEWVDHSTIKLLITEEDRKQLRKEIIEEANRICYLCGEYIPEGQNPTLDHVNPKSRLGEETKENQKCCCKRCNDDKSDTPLKIYVIRIRDNSKDYPWITADRLALLLKLYVE